MTKLQFKRWLYLLPLTVVSCTNGLDDFDVLGMKSPGWEESFVSTSVGPESEPELQMKNSGLKLKDRELLDVEKSSLSLESFFEAENLYFPVYPNDLRSFKLVSYKDMCQDSSSIHMGADALLEYVDSLLNDDYNYKVYRCMWDYQGVPISTISLYNENDELLYDNIQFNLITARQLHYDGRRRNMLTRSEGPYYGVKSGGAESFFHDSNGNQLAEAVLYWEEFGRSRDGVPLYHGSSMYAILYHYSHENLVVNPYVYVQTDFAENVVAKAEYEDMSVHDAGRLKYYVWAGPKNEYLSNYQTELESRIHYPFVSEDLIIYSTHVIDTLSRYDGCLMQGYYGAWEYTEQEVIEYL